MDPEIIQLRRNLNTFTLAELKKEVIKMKSDKFAVTKMKRNQVVNLILTYHYLFPYLMNKTGSTDFNRFNLSNISFSSSYI